MKIMITEIYDAFMAAGAGEEKSRAAAEAVASYENRFAGIERRLDVLTWMVSVNLAGTVALIGLVTTLLLKLVKS